MDVLDYEVFYDAVFAAARSIFNESQYKYLKKTRLQKLAILVFKELDYPINGFVWGLYKFGPYSPQLNNYLKLRVPSESIDLGDIRPYEHIIPQHLIRRIKETILSYKDHFIKPKEDFKRWVYKNLVDPEYRRFYDFHHKFLSCLDEASEHGIDKECKERLDHLITEYYSALEHLSDKVLFLFANFTDIIEDLALISLKKPNYKINKYLHQLKEIYSENIYPLLTPYEVTLQGDKRRVQKELSRFRKKKKSILEEVYSKLDKIYQSLEEEELLPSFIDLVDDLEQTVKKHPNTKPLNDIISQFSRWP